MTDGVSAQYEVAVADERHYRDALQRRLAYHTNLVVVAVAAIAAAMVRVDTIDGIRTLGVLLVALGAFAIFTPWALRRLYLHFLEHLDARERLEVVLGVRDRSAVASPQRMQSLLGGAPKPTPYTPNVGRLTAPLFSMSWVGGSGKGYFWRVTWGFRVAGALIALLGIWAILNAAGFARGNAEAGELSTPSGAEASVTEMVRSRFAVGPFGLGESCFTDAVRIAQVDSLLSELRRTNARAFTLVGSVDLVPVRRSATSFESNASLAAARARCVAGWMMDRDPSALRNVYLRIATDDGGQRRLPGTPQARHVFAWFEAPAESSAREFQ